MKSAQQGSANWANSSGRAQTAYTEGVNNYSGDWAGRTIAQKQAWIQGLADAQARNSWENGISGVGTNGWKTRTQAKAGNYATGFTAGASRQASAMAKIIQAEANIVGSLTPRGSYEQNMQRQRQVTDGLHALKGQLGAS